MNEDMEKRLQEEVMYRELSVGSEAVDADARTAELTFSSETPVKRWFGNEILCHDAACVHMERLNEIGVLLWNHNSNKPIGKIVDAYIGDDFRGHAKVEFDTDEESDVIFQKVLSGTLKGVSVGYRITRLEEVTEGETSSNGRFQGPAEVATAWEPLEISIVSVPADAGVGVGRSVDVPDDAAENKKSIEEKENEKMDEKDKKPQEIDAEAIRKSAVEAERKRVDEITGLYREFDMDPADAISKGISVEEARKAVLAELKAKQKPIIQVVADGFEKYVKAATDGLALRAGLVVEKPADGADSFRGMSMKRLAAAIYEHQNGKSAAMMSDEELLRATFTGTGAFPNILADVSHKALLNAYNNEAATTYQLWTKKGSNSDFKPAHRPSLTAAASLTEVKENGEIEYDEIGDSNAVAVVGTYAKGWTISRKAIINDDLGALTDLPRMYGVAARRTINEKVYALLTSNGIFTSAHHNTGTGALSMQTLAAAKALMARQTDPSGRAKLNVIPAFLIVPPELEFLAKQLIHSSVDPTKNNAAFNPFTDSMVPVSDPNLTDADAWYLAAAPGLTPTIEVTFLNGKDVPTVETAVDFDTLGIKGHVVADFGVNLLDFRGLYKSTGK